MAALPVEILLGIYLGILTGIIPALVAWALGFLFKYFTGVTIPALAVVALALAIAGANGGLLALNDPTVRGAPNSVTLTTAIVVVLMVSIYAHSKGDAMGAAFPKHISLRRLRERTLSADVVELVGGRGQVRITVAGEVGDIEGFPPLSTELRDEIRGEEWTFPADLPLPEIERRLAEKLRTEYDLTDASVRIDERGRATVSAAPPTSGVSKRVPAGRRAVSVRALVPTGMARGEEVTVITDDEHVRGTVVSAQSSVPSGPGPGVRADGGEADTEEPSVAPGAPTTDGGDGRVTVAVSQGDARTLLDAERARVIVRSRGTRREFELLSLLRRAGKRFRKVPVGEAGELAGTTIGDAAVRDAHGVAILAIRRPDGWTLAPRGSTELRAGDELFAVGTREALDRFVEVAA